MNKQKQGRADFAVWPCDFQFDTARLKPVPQKTKKTVFPQKRRNIHCWRKKLDRISPVCYTASKESNRQLNTHISVLSSDSHLHNRRCKYASGLSAGLFVLQNSTPLHNTAKNRVNLTGGKTNERICLHRL